jgi:class 3 adenylate cyclase
MLKAVGLRSVVAKNVLLFLAILVVAVGPLSWQYYRDSRDYEIQNLASKLEFFAERGATWLDVRAITTVTGPEHRGTAAYARLLADLSRIKREFDVDNAVVLRRDGEGRYVYVAIDHGGFAPGDPAEIHDLFPATFRATDDTWRAGEMMHSQLFGGRVEGTDYAQFLQINTPLKLGDEVVAILMLNKFADPVAEAVRMKTMRVTALSLGLFAAGLALFAVLSARMLRPLKLLTTAAGEVASGNLEVAVPPARSRDEVGRLSASFSGMLEGLRQRDFIRDTFGRYISREVVDTLLGSPDGLKLGGDRREITLLVSDLRGFTSLAGRLSPEEVIGILNRYLERVVEILTRYRATVDEFQGDGILAFFGAPLAAPDDAERAVACAIEMQRAVVDLNAEQRRRGLPELEMGIGINTGVVIVGNIGSEKRTKYGAVGAAINLAYRIESQTVGGQVLLGPRTCELVQDLVDVRGTLEVALKGVDAPLTIHDVCGVRGRYATSLPEAVVVAPVALDPPVAATCYAVDGKRVAEAGFAARLTAVSATAAEAAVEGGVTARATLKLVVAMADAPAEAYAKVVAVRPGGEVTLAFTTVSPAMRRFLDARCPSAAGAPVSSTPHAPR